MPKRPKRQSRFSRSRRCCLPRIVLGIFCLAAFGVTASRAQPAAVTPDTPDISSWIKQLASPKFAEREAASSHLKTSGLAGIPDLVKAAQGSNPEVTARAIEALSYLYESADVNVSLAADRALEQLLNEGPPGASLRTEQAFAFDLAPARRRNTIAAIQSLGGILITKVQPDPETRLPVQMNLDEPDSIQHAILGKEWRGDLSNTKYLERLRPELNTVYITSDAPLKTGELELYKAALPLLRVEPRGGYLGIGGTVFDPEHCVVDHIAPNSPAELAGLKEGDLLTHMDGLPIKGFNSLTSMLLQRKSGQTIILDVLRGSRENGIEIEDLDLTITLGEWGGPSKLQEKRKATTPKQQPDQESPPKPAVKRTPGPSDTSPKRPDAPPPPRKP